MTYGYTTEEAEEASQHNTPVSKEVLIKNDTYALFKTYEEMLTQILHNYHSEDPKKMERHSYMI